MIESHESCCANEADNGACPDDDYGVDVAMAAYNADSFVGTSLSALRGIDCIRTITIVDNASTDSSVAEIEKHAAEDPRLRLVKNSQNLGFGVNTNCATRAGSSPYILILSPDVELTDPSVVQAGVSLLEFFPSVGIYAPGLFTADGGFDQASKRGEPTAWRVLAYFLRLHRVAPNSTIFAGYLAPHVPATSIGAVDAVNGAFMLIRRRDFELIGGIDERFYMYAGDIDLCRRYRSAGMRCIYDGTHRATRLDGASNHGRRPTQARRSFWFSVLQYGEKHARNPIPYRAVQAGARIAHGWIQSVRSVEATQSAP